MLANLNYEQVSSDMLGRFKDLASRLPGLQQSLRAGATNELGAKFRDGVNKLWKTIKEKGTIE
eukprot:5669258-Amphidinium_carterae.1